MATLKTRSSTISQNSNVRLNAASTLAEPTEIPITNDISKENRNQLPPETAELKMFVQGNKISINTKAKQQILILAGCCQRFPRKVRNMNTTVKS